MDPRLFQLNYEMFVAVLIAIVFRSMILERTLNVLFESRIFKNRTLNIK